MRLIDIYNEIEKIAPKSLSDEYCARFGAYDNSGVLVDTGEEIDKVVFSLDFSRPAIERAIEENAKLIITHHPAIYSKIGDIRVNDFDPIDAKLLTCIKNGISVISMHLNLDVAKAGIDDALAEGIRLSSGACTKISENNVMHALSDVGYGKTYDIKEISLGALRDNVKKTFFTNRVEVYGELDKIIKRVASFCGGGADEEAVAFAKEQGADVMVSSDFKHHVLLLAKESGVSVLTLTHYASENYGFEQFYKKISERISLPCVFITDKEML